MAVVKPFFAIRPAKEMAAKVAALPYDVMTSAEAREMVKGNPVSFLHVDKAEIDLDASVGLYDDLVYETARKNLNRWLAEGVLKKDKKRCFYLYRLTMDGRSQTGVVAMTSIDDYLNGVIKKHELTREDKEQDRIRHVESCDANTGPIFLTYPDSDAILTIVEDWKVRFAPEVDFVSEDGIGHTVWVLDEDGVMETLSRLFADIPSLYIADGHHRNASAVKVGLKKREANPEYTGDEEFNYYLSVLFPAGELKILEYNRLVKDWNGKSKEDILSEILNGFVVSPAPTVDGKVIPVGERHSFLMYLEKTWYLLKARSEILEGADEIASLDVSILQNYILQPVFGIGDPRSDKRIDFVGGIRGLGELVRRVDSGEMSVGFALFPTSIQDLMCVADADKIMPPKSTWFEPKLRSGLFIHSLS